MVYFVEGSCFPLLVGSGYTHIPSYSSTMSSGTIIGRLRSSNRHWMHSTAFGQFFKKQSTSGQLLYGETFVHSASIIVLVLVMLPACRASFQAFLDLPPFPTPSLGDSSTADFVDLHFSPFWATQCSGDANFVFLFF